MQSQFQSRSIIGGVQTYYQDAICSARMLVIYTSSTASKTYVKNLLLVGRLIQAHLSSCSNSIEAHIGWKFEIKSWQFKYMVSLTLKTWAVATMLLVCNQVLMLMSGVSYTHLHP